MIDVDVTHRQSSDEIVGSIRHHSPLPALPDARFKAKTSRGPVTFSHARGSFVVAIC